MKFENKSFFQTNQSAGSQLLSDGEEGEEEGFHGEQGEGILHR